MIQTPNLQMQTLKGTHQVIRRITEPKLKHQTNGQQQGGEPRANAIPKETRQSQAYAIQTITRTNATRQRNEMWDDQFYFDRERAKSNLNRAAGALNLTGAMRGVGRGGGGEAAWLFSQSQPHGNNYVLWRLVAQGKPAGWYGA